VTETKRATQAPVPAAAARAEAASEKQLANETRGANLQISATLSARGGVAAAAA